MQSPLREAAEYARPNPLVLGVINGVLKVVAAADEEKPFRQSLLPVRAAELAVSVIQCNDAPARKLLLGDHPRMRLLEFLEQMIITIIEEAIGLVKKRCRSTIHGKSLTPASASRRRWRPDLLRPKSVNLPRVIYANRGRSCQGHGVGPGDGNAAN
jgi:hypothetical protein